MCKIVFIRLQLRVLCDVAYLLYITIIIFWNQTERLFLGHLKDFALIFSYIDASTPWAMPVK